MTVMVIRATGDGSQYQWRGHDARSGWHGPSQCGSLSQLREQCRGASAWLLVDGPDIVMRRFAVTAAERKHLSQLIPFELESDIAGDISQLHVALGQASTESVPVAYVDRQWLQTQINTLELAGIEVSHCYISSQLLKCGPAGWSLQWVEDADRVWINFRWRELGISCDPDMVPLLIQRLVEQQAAAEPEQIALYGHSSNQTEALRALIHQALPGHLQVHVTDQVLADTWDSLDLNNVAAVDLRQGALAAPLRWQKYWRALRTPTLAAAAAVVIFLLAAFVELQINNASYRNLQSEIEQAYRDAVPQGALVDAEQQLRSQLAQLRGDAAGAALLPLLDQIAPVLLQHDAVRVHRLSFQAAQQGLQLALTAPSNAQLLALGEALSSAGMQAQTRNISRAGDRQQANLLVTGGYR